MLRSSGCLFIPSSQLRIVYLFLQSPAALDGGHHWPCQAFSSHWLPKYSFSRGHRRQPRNATLMNDIFIHPLESSLCRISILIYPCCSNLLLSPSISAHPWSGVHPSWHTIHPRVQQVRRLLSVRVSRKPPPPVPIRIPRLLWKCGCGSRLLVWIPDHLSNYSTWGWTAVWTVWHPDRGLLNMVQYENRRPIPRHTHVT